MIELVQLLRENKLLSASVVLACTASSYLVQEWYSHDQDLAQREILVSQAEEERVAFQRVVDLRSVYGGLLPRLGKRLQEQAQTMTLAEVVEQVAEDRRELGEAIAATENTHIGEPLLQELQTYLVGNIREADTVYGKLVLVVKARSSGAADARERMDELRMDVERLGLAIGARRATVDDLWSRAKKRRERGANELKAWLKMFQIRRQLAVAAWIYIGSFVLGLAIRAAFRRGW